MNEQTRKALELAREALFSPSSITCFKAIDAIDAALSAPAAPVAQPSDEVSLIALREWAVSRWRAEVECRPLINVHRRSLDDTWRQVMRYAGLDPEEAVGPSHDELVQHDLAGRIGQGEDDA